MKSTGITRPVDGLGRVVIPKEIRRSLEITEDETRLEVFLDGEDIILRKHKSGCCICGEVTDIKDFKGTKFCPSCLSDIKKLK